MLRMSFQIAVLFSLSATLAAAEDQKAVKSQRPAERNDLDVGRFFDEFDKNKDGYITKDELPQSLRYCFDKIDTNKDGKISRDELRKGAAYFHPRRRPSDAIFILIEMSDCDECCTEEVQPHLRCPSPDRHEQGRQDRPRRTQGNASADRARTRGFDNPRHGQGQGWEDQPRRSRRGDLRNFDALDLNKDGYVDHDELMQAASAKHPAAAGKLPDTGNRASK